MAASSSAWLWDAASRLYYSPTTSIWAAPQADGTWTYSAPTKAAAPTASGATTPAQPTQPDREEGELDGEPLPEDQVWPGEEEPSPQTRFDIVPLLRLVVLSSTVLSSPHSIAPVDPADGLSIGRDKSFEKRVRLKELAVSKAHAALFWMSEWVGEEREPCWCVSDSGSTHGTFLGRRREMGGAVEETRLSSAKAASKPHELRHIDTLRIGSTTFSVHVHPTFSCDTCAVAADSSNLIPLLSPDPSSIPTPDRHPEAYSTKTKSQKEQDRREKMRGLKDQFLKPANSASKPSPVSSAPSSAPKPFIDRAAARRQRTGPSKPPTPSPSPFFTVPGSAPSQSAPPTAPPSNPFASSSRGALLLSKMSGEPSGSAGGGLGALIQPKSFDTKTTGREERPGLGSKKLVVIGEQAGSAGGEGKRGWREDVREANRKRFREMDG